MDDFEVGAVIFLGIIAFGIAGYLAASFLAEGKSAMALLITFAVAVGIAKAIIITRL